MTITVEQHNGRVNRLEERRVSLAEEKYKAKYIIEKAIIDAISDIPPHPTLGVARDNFTIWCEDEEGDQAIDRLVNLIIY